MDITTKETESIGMPGVLRAANQLPVVMAVILADPDLQSVIHGKGPRPIPNAPM
ncbi:phosphotransferase enzyme family protein [Aspergillus luchuensis]|uniref:Phosphotransferase enzyme family protein n=1 Tax=Aspergillus kawachii TaxID=1069201 RepID=A0A146FTE5_ASPKA|nr:phosphotransferase enzyme family protein [Aspergillus luchuensis]